MCEVIGVIRWPKYIISPSQKWSDEEPKEYWAIQSVQYNDITASRCSSPRYIRVQWRWIGMIYKVTCVVIATYNIQWIKISIVDEDIWYTLETLESRSREMKSHEYWNDQGGNIYGIPPSWKVFYSNPYEYMSYYVNRCVKVKHSSPSSDYLSLMYTVNKREITHR